MNEFLHSVFYLLSTPLVGCTMLCCPGCLLPSFFASSILCITGRPKDYGLFLPPLSDVDENGVFCGVVNLMTVVKHFHCYL